MGIPTRHEGAPYKGGERASGPELEQDISSIYDEFNGNIDDDNFASNANLDGAKLLIGSVGNTRLQELSIQGTNLANDAIESAKIEDDAISTEKMAVGTVLNTVVGLPVAAKAVTFGAWDTHFSASLTTSAATLGALLIFSFELYYPAGTASGNNTQIRLMKDDGAPVLIHQFHDVCRYTASTGPQPSIAETMTLIAGAYIAAPLAPSTNFVFSVELQKLINASAIETIQGSLTVIEMRR